jgi:hypothetical protein
LKKSPFRIEANLQKAIVQSPGKPDRPVQGPIELKPGDKLLLPVKVLWSGDGPRPGLANVSAEPTSALPGGNNNPLNVINNSGQNVPRDKDETTIVVEARINGTPGEHVINLRGDVRANMAKEGTTEKRDYVMLAFAEPIPVTVIPLSLAKISVSQEPLRLGQASTVRVRVERLGDYQGEYRATIAFSDKSGLKTLTATIPAHQSEVRVPVTLDGAKPGNVSATVTVQGTFLGRTIAAETKTQFTIAK